MERLPKDRLIGKNKVEPEGFRHPTLPRPPAAHLAIMTYGLWGTLHQGNFVGAFVTPVLTRRVPRLVSCSAILILKIIRAF